MKGTLRAPLLATGLDLHRDGRLSPMISGDRHVLEERGAAIEISPSTVSTTASKVWRDVAGMIEVLE